MGRITAEKGVKICLGQAFSVPEDFRLEDYSNVPPWNFLCEAPAKEVCVQFERSEFWRISDFCSSHGAVRETDADSVEWTLTVRSYDPLVNWLLPLGTAAIPMSPPEFVQRYREVVTEMLERYTTEVQ